MTDKQTPDDLRYTTEHEWVKKVSDTTVRVGITDYAQDQLGDVVFVQLPAVDDEVVVGESFAEVESTKSVSDIFGPLAGVVTNVNDRLEASPDLVNSEPYGMGWLVEINVGDDADLDAVLGEMLDASGYREVTAG
ncbi:glycine cleavage system protein GcvH [Williamsia muralis]|uniref:Glycine cleavage system H protein n=1 Tax=Williamsia marianensis TaxID=85044 RepID=A0A2G3PQW2_WILMA|nr:MULTISPECIES: glycine cleavage system protein GcvH [Williamsia]MCK0518960.1 glycine cleavage system protein GcvH [Williamsia sp. DF01-3]MDV7137027.1 glycine cleavage system protein GcvH [Williamsia muralis]PHV67472.1 glycine cleavage system protein H [Williamsia marianensis]PZU02482.1 MAG: glycine cleavage system protein GcvH [Gordonia sp. (in: high G+C Gram-positive bacteria)]